MISTISMFFMVYRYIYIYPWWFPDMVRKWDQQKRGFLMINPGPKIASEIGLRIFFPSKKKVSYRLVSNHTTPPNPPRHTEYLHPPKKKTTNLQPTPNFPTFSPPFRPPKNSTPPISMHSPKNSTRLPSSAHQSGAVPRHASIPGNFVGQKKLVKPSGSGGLFFWVLGKVVHPGRWTAGTYSHHPWKERKMIWTKPPGNYVQNVNLQGGRFVGKHDSPWEDDSLHRLLRNPYIYIH